MMWRTLSAAPRIRHVPRTALATALLLVPSVLLLAGGSLVGPRLVSDEIVVDAGAVTRGTLVRRSLRITNTGRAASGVAQVAADCGARAVDVAAITLGPRAASDVVIEVDTFALHDGPNIATVTLAPRDRPDRTLRVSMKLSVQSEFELSKSLLHFSPSQKTAELLVRTLEPSTSHVVAARTTDTGLTATLIRDQHRPVTTVVVTGDRLSERWDLGTLIITTSSPSLPDLRVPLRGTLQGVLKPPSAPLVPTLR